MRTHKRNKQKIYYAEYVSRTPNVDANGNMTGEYTLTYSDIKSAWMNVTSAIGNSWTNVVDKNLMEPYGVSSPYTRTMLSDEPSLPITETSVIWIDAPTTGPNDYEIIGIARYKYTVSYSVKRVYEVE